MIFDIEKSNVNTSISKLSSNCFPIFEVEAEDTRYVDKWDAVKVAFNRIFGLADYSSKTAACLLGTSPFEHRLRFRGGEYSWLSCKCHV
jgi:hypothetical protein